MKTHTCKIVVLYCIFISLVIYIILANITPVIASIKFPISSILNAEKCQQAGHLTNKMTIFGLVIPQILTDCRINYELTVVGNDVYRGSSSDTLVVTIKQASAAAPIINSGIEKESNSYPVYKIAIIIIALVGVPGTLLILRSIVNKADTNRLRSSMKIEVEVRGGLRGEASDAGNRAVSGSYTISMFDLKFRNALGDFFAEALKEREFRDQEQFQSIASWYEEITEPRGEQRDENSILLNMTNQMTEQLLKNAEPFFMDSFINRIRAKTQFLDGVETDLRIGFIPIEAYVEYTKLVGAKKIFSVKFWFSIETDTSVKELSIKPDLHIPELKLMVIRKMDVELRFLLQKMEGTDLSLDTNMILGEKMIEINDLSYGIRLIF